MKPAMRTIVEPIRRVVRRIINALSLRQAGTR
jgi:hypothetical protein